MKRVLPTALAAALALAAPAAAQDPVLPATGAEYSSSPNVELVGQIKTVGDGVGAAVVGNTLYVTTTKSLSIFDITNPENPRSLGITTMNVEFENEEVPTNGKILGISSEIGCHDNPTAAAGGCLTLYDVTNPAAPVLKSVVTAAGSHTSACVLDCQFFYGSEGPITDATDPANAKVIGDWRKSFRDGTFQGGCHHVREIRPGYILGSCTPIVLMSVLPEDGGSITKPVIIAQGDSKRGVYIHSSRWPRMGRDRWVLVGEETNAQPQCDDTVASFMTFDATGALDPMRNFIRGGEFKLVDETRPTQGNYANGSTPVNALGCSVHWFQEHPSFRDGGLVALSEYENGTRLVQIKPDGKIVEQGYFLPLGGSASAPHWAPNGKVFYSIDYTRGVDIVRYTGDTYVPAAGEVPAQPGSTPGAGSDPLPAACASAAGFRTASANPTAKGLRFSIDRREERSFDIDVVQVSSGRTVVNRTRASFDGQTDGFDWNGAAGTDGRYVVRFTMRMDGKVRDVRETVLNRKKGVFKALTTQTRTSCGAVDVLALDAPVFGGRKRDTLKVSYRLDRPAERISVEARSGKKLIKRWRGGTKVGRNYTFKLTAKAARRYRNVQVRVVATRDGVKVASDPVSAARL